jgi:diguanylate cyclase (GGDEF)-like protein
MNSVFRQISLSPNADAWRRFRIPSEQLHRLTAAIRALGCRVGEVSPQGHSAILLTEFCDGQRVLSIAEPSSQSPSPFSVGGETWSMAATESPEALLEYATWVKTKAGATALTPTVPSDSSPLALLLQQEEHLAWATLECQILRAVQSVSQLDLEGEPLLISLSHAIHEIISPDFLELRFDTPADYWPGRATGWSWSEDHGSAPSTSIELTPRLQRLLYRRERVLFVEDLTAAPDIQFTPEHEARRFSCGFLLPLVFGGKPIGTLILFWSKPLVPLAGDVEALELFRRELSLLLDRSRMHLRTQRMATVDGLTNLFNHRFFRDQLRTEFQRCLRYQKTMAMIMIDIDDFKGYNDRYGHLAGDRVLSETARAIHGSVRDIDFVARYGGEEFALILPEVDAHSGVIVAEKIRKAVEAQRFISEEGEAIGSITVSCGVTDNVGTATPEDLIVAADRALYWVKRHGRNLVRLSAADDGE